jgi:hypothetical protein
MLGPFDRLRSFDKLTMLGPFDRLRSFDKLTMLGPFDRLRANGLRDQSRPSGAPSGNMWR